MMTFIAAVPPRVVAITMSSDSAAARHLNSVSFDISGASARRFKMMGFSFSAPAHRNAIAERR